MGWRHTFLFLLLMASGTARAGEVPRVVLGLHDAPQGASDSTTNLYALAEMPLNHLGLKLEYDNVRDGVPQLNGRKDVRGILVWLTDGRKLPLRALAALAREAAAREIPVVFIGNLPNGTDNEGRTITLDDQNALLAPIGVRSKGDFIPSTYNLKLAIKDKAMVEFERPLPSAPPATEAIAPFVSGAVSYLAYDRKGDEGERSHMVVLTPSGGYVAAGYTHFEDKSGEFLQWYLNPFRFFSQAFHAARTPIPDTTTISGRRIYYSHIDGDGWGSVSTADKYAGKGVYASEVVLHEVAAGYPDLPVTVAPIAADIDVAWTGTLRSQQIARAFFRLPNVEPATHTYTHPFEWGYFSKGYRPEKEMVFAKRYTKLKVAQGIVAQSGGTAPKLALSYEVPRAYGDIPFSLGRENDGSVAYINSFCPPGKRVALVQWSGDTSPFEEAVAAATRAGLQNLNGRDTRFDGDTPSYASVSPIGKLSGRQMQISASHANENVYTDLWQGRFYGFRFLKTSLANTEVPMRVKPINLYYHMYSGEKQASLAALLDVLSYASTQEVAPITASRFAAIGQGFFTTRMEEMAPLTWQIEQRGALNTLRVDRAATLNVDFDNSPGVLGARRNNDVLYIALDPAERTPRLRLVSGPAPNLRAPRLVESRWPIERLRGDLNSAEFVAQGYGAGKMTWKLPVHGSREEWDVLVDGKRVAGVVVDASGLASFTVPGRAEAGVTISMRRSSLRPALP